MMSEIPATTDSTAPASVNRPEAGVLFLQAFVAFEDLQLS
jgi:hypothetical protein